MLPQFTYILIFYRVDYSYINIHGYFFFSELKKKCKKRLKFLLHFESFNYIR